MKIGRLSIYLAMVLIFGGAGCWIALGQHFHDPEKYAYRAFVANIGTFGISISVLAYADRILSKKQISATYGLFIFFLMATSSAACVLCIVLNSRVETLLAAAGLFGALTCWTLIKWNSPEFVDKPDPFSTMGGQMAEGNK